jgi:hypothetical protein
MSLNISGNFCASLIRVTGEEGVSAFMLLQRHIKQFVVAQTQTKVALIRGTKESSLLGLLSGFQLYIIFTKSHVKIGQLFQSLQWDSLTHTHTQTHTHTFHV